MHARIVVVMDLVRVEIEPYITPRPQEEISLPPLVPGLTGVQHKEREVEDSNAER